MILFREVTLKSTLSTKTERTFSYLLPLNTCMMRHPQVLTSAFLPSIIQPAYNKKHDNSFRLSFGTRCEIFPKDIVLS